MKGSTLRRSNITREKIAMLESLAKYNNKYNNTRTPVDKQEELDVLWQNFKVASRTEKSPIAFFTSGVLVGVVSTLVVAILISLVVGYSPLEDLNISISNPFNKGSNIESSKFTFIPADKDATGATAPKTKVATGTNQGEVYTVQEGDTLESIIIRFYGSYSVKYEEAIKEANNMKNPNALSIGQKLRIPLN